MTNFAAANLWRQIRNQNVDRRVGVVTNPLQSARRGFFTSERPARRVDSKRRVNAFLATDKNQMNTDEKTI
jgi:hypothetical protein